MAVTNYPRNKLGENLRVRYNGLDDLFKNSEEPVEFLIQTVKVRTKRNEYNESSAVYFFSMTIDPKGVNRTEEVHKKMKNLREFIHPEILT